MVIMKIEANEYMMKTPLFGYEDLEFQRFLSQRC